MSFKYDITKATTVDLQNSYLYGVLNLQVLQRSMLLLLSRFSPVRLCATP